VGLLVEEVVRGVRRESEVVSSEKYVVTAVSKEIQGKPLILLQVNCRTILNKILEFWNLVDTCNPYVINAQSHGLGRKLTILKYLGITAQPSGNTSLLGGGMFVVLKSISNEGSYGWRSILI
jgi:hypothetical protein